MSAAALLEDLKDRGAAVWTEGDKLKYAGPKDALGPDVVRQLGEHKAEIVALLAERQRPAGREAATEGSAEVADLSGFTKQKLEKASALGLVARWSRHFGYISIHDPVDGTWHDLPTGDAPDWSVRESIWNFWFRVPPAD